MKTLHIESRNYVAPIWWAADAHNAETVLHNGSCFVVEVGDVRFGVTANHVIAEFLRDREIHPRLRLMVRNTDITDWDSRVIATDPALDVATFRLSGPEFASMQLRALQHSVERWPPPPPQAGRGVFFVGYAGVDRRVVDKRTVEFLQVSNGVVLTSLGPDELEVQIDRRDLAPLDGVPVPSLTKDVGGYSGAPLLIVSSNPAGPLFWLGGIVVRQLRAKNENDTTTIWARRPGCINGDGRLRPSRYVIEDPASSV